jgi:hypothetical protein
MLQLRHCLGFTAEAGQLVGAGVIAGQDHLERDQPNCATSRACTWGRGKRKPTSTD